MPKPPEWFSRIPMGIKSKFFVGLLGAILGLAAIGMFGLIALDKANDRARELARLNRQADILREMNYHASQIDAAALHAILFSRSNIDPKLGVRSPATVFAPRIDNIKLESVRTSRSIGRETGLTDARQAELEDLSTRVSSLIQKARELDTILKQKQIDEAEIFYNNEVATAAKRIDRGTYSLLQAIESETARKVAASDEEFATARWQLLALVGLILMGVVVLGVLISLAFTRPLSHIQSRLSQISKGEFGNRIHIASRDELGELATDVNEMSGRLEELYSELADKTGRLEELSKKLSRYLSPQIYASIFSGEQTAEVAAKRKKLTVFFSDIADFTATADKLESEELTTLLNEYLTEMSSIAIEHGATIDKFIGDAILVFFGDPESTGVRQDARACVLMAQAMQRQMKVIRKSVSDRGIDDGFEMRIGIATGFCTVGNFGSEDRLDYTAIGNTVNLAARLQTQVERGGILLSAETYALVKDDILAKEQESVELKGIPHPVRTFKVIDRQDETDDDDLLIRHEQLGLQLQIDQRELAGTARAAAIKTLKEAITKLKK